MGTSLVLRDPVQGETELQTDTGKEFSKFGIITDRQTKTFNNSKEFSLFLFCTTERKSSEIECKWN